MILPIFLTLIFKTCQNFAGKIKHAAVSWYQLKIQPVISRRVGSGWKAVKTSDN